MPITTAARRPITKMARTPIITMTRRPIATTARRSIYLGLVAGPVRRWWRCRWDVHAKKTVEGGASLLSPSPLFLLPSLFSSFFFSFFLLPSPFSFFLLPPSLFSSFPCPSPTPPLCPRGCAGRGRRGGRVVEQLGRPAGEAAGATRARPSAAGLLGRGPVAGAH